MLDSWLQTLPKAELHVHLEGFVDAPLWHALLLRHRKASEVPSLAELQSQYHYSDFKGFIRCFAGVVNSFVEPEDFYLLTQHALATQASQGIVYTETYFTPLFYFNKNMDFHAVMSAIDQAACEAERKTGIKMRLLFDGARNFGPESVQQVFERATQDRTNRVIGVGLGGDEKNHPAHKFAHNFAWAKAQGLYTVCHAGETAGAESMLEAIEQCGARRLGHGLAVQPGSKLEALIMEQDICLELCPTSNVRTGQIKTVASHPFPRYLKAGYPLVLGSDDPGFFQSNLLQEMQTLTDLYGLGPKELAKLASNSFQYSFLPEDEKNQWLQKVEKFFKGFPQS